MKRRLTFLTCIAATALIGSLAIGLMANAQETNTKQDTEAIQPTNPKPAADPDLVADLKLIQGSWELQHGNAGKGRPTTRSIKTIEGNKETLRRYNAATGKKNSEHSVEIKLSKSGEVRVCTFYRVGGSPDQGLSFVYKVDAENYYDIPGMLQGREYRNYQETPKVWHWKRLAPEDVPVESEPQQGAK